MTPTEFGDQPSYRGALPEPPAPKPKSSVMATIDQLKAELAQKAKDNPNYGFGADREPVYVPPPPPPWVFMGLTAVEIGDQVWVDEERGWQTVRGLVADPPADLIGILWVSADPEPEFFPADQEAHVIHV